MCTMAFLDSKDMFRDGDQNRLHGFDCEGLAPFRDERLCLVPIRVVSGKVKEIMPSHRHVLGEPPGTFLDARIDGPDQASGEM